MVTLAEASSCDGAVELIRCAPYSIQLDGDGYYSQVFHNNTNTTFWVFGLVMETSTTMWSSNGGDYFSYEWFAGDNGAILLAGAAGTGIPHCTCFTVTVTGGHPYDKGVFLACVPEPASLALMGLGIAGLAAARRRRHRC